MTKTEQRKVKLHQEAKELNSRAAALMKNGNVIIKDRLIRFFDENGQEVKCISLKDDNKLKTFLKHIRQIGTVNITDTHRSLELAISPLESDRKGNRRYWSTKCYIHKIRLPYFMLTELFLLAKEEKVIPTNEYIKVYMWAYTREKAKINQYCKGLVNPQCFDYQKAPDDHINFSNGADMPNRILEFVPGVKYLLIENQFTTYQIIARLLKVRFPVLRDIYITLALQLRGIDAVYDFKRDIKGIDILVNGFIPIMNFTNTKYGCEFADEKQSERHDFSKYIAYDENGKIRAIMLKPTCNDKNSDRFIFPSDEVLDSLAEKIKDFTAKRQAEYTEIIYD